MNIFEYRRGEDLKKKTTEFNRKAAAAQAAQPQPKKIEKKASPPPAAQIARAKEQEQQEQRRMVGQGFRSSNRRKQRQRMRQGVEQWVYDPRVERYREQIMGPSASNKPNITHRKGESDEQYAERQEKYKELIQDWFYGETVRDFFRRHWIHVVFIGKPLWLLVPATFLGLISAFFMPQFWIGVIPLLLITVLALAWYINDWLNDWVVVTSIRIIHLEKTLFLNTERVEIPLEKVQEIRFTKKKNLFEFFFDIGTIEITSSGQTKLIFNQVRDPVRIRKEWDQLKSSYITARATFRKDRTRNYIENRIFGVPLKDWNSDYKNYQIEAIEEPNRWDRLFPNGPVKTGKDEITWHTHIFFLYMRAFQVFLMFVGWVIFGLFGIPYLASLNIPVLGIVVTVLYFLMLFVFGFLLWYKYKDWIDDIFVLSGDKINDIKKSPFGFDEQVGTVEIRNIQDIQFEQNGFLANFLDFGDVVIKTVGGSGTTLRRVPGPDEIKDEVLRRKEAIKLAEEDRADRATADNFASYYLIVRTPPPGYE